jgi:hypothetical protein
VGTWVAPDLKTVSVDWSREGITVTVSPGPEQAPYTSAPLLGGDTKVIEHLPARCYIDDKGRKYLEVEAGTPGVGPVYRLYAAVHDARGRHIAADDVPVERLVLVPNTSTGLYDEYEDDLGVPWAYPLNPLAWQFGP